MFGLLFEEENETESSTSSSFRTNKNIKQPPAPRSKIGLAGISNQGATCYLNSLLQTLLFTPEFRSSLFELGSKDIGSLEDNKAGKRVRIIPLQLQRLFARLLLSNQQSISTTELTDSFGWNNNEALQQHDVQELNRILFCAIEDSLVGTTGSNLIHRLYHGNIVNQIICSKCGKISEREEDFLDLTITLGENSDLESALFRNYIEMETMDGSNQYRCDICQCLVDAKKGAKLRNLPEILTLSLLRFSYDYVKQERYKENKNFMFPLRLDMAPYIEHPSDEMMYELFSVVIHRGGAHGGHYHAYIKDIDNLGEWTNPEEETIELIQDPSTGNVDLIECDSPTELLQVILKKSTLGIMTVDMLCSEMTKQTGVSWNKRFKRQYGSIHKFLSKHCDIFDYDPSSHSVSLKAQQHGIASPEIADVSDQKQELENLKESCNISQTKKATKEMPSPGNCWFDFDDSRIHSIYESDITKTYGGKSSAYMLFYRHTSLASPVEAFRNKLYNLPDNLVAEILQENEELQAQREDYEMEINKISIQVHLGDSYKFSNGALNPQPDKLTYVTITLDRRQTVGDLRALILEAVREAVPYEFIVHTMKEHLAGYHLYKHLSDEQTLLKDIPIQDQGMVFLWNGNDVCGKKILVGENNYPVCVTVHQPSKKPIVHGFPRKQSFQQFTADLAQLTGIPWKQVLVKRLIGNDETKMAVDFSEEQCQGTLEDAKIKDGTEVIVTNSSKESNSNFASIVTVDQSILVYVENQIQEEKNQGVPRIQLRVDKRKDVLSIKKEAMNKFKIQSIKDGGRLRIEDDTLGLRAPLCDTLCLSDANIGQGTSLVLESGPAPSSSQLTLTITQSSSEFDDIEVMVEGTISVDQCLQCVLQQLGFNEDSWHLRKTNWCGEAAEILDDLDMSLTQSCINNGDRLLLEPGKLPPKGYMRLDVDLYPTLCKPFQTSCGNEDLLEFLSQIISNPQIHQKNKFDSVLCHLGSIQISLMSTLNDLKQQIISSLLMDVVPMTSMLRIRMIEAGRLSTVLKGSELTLQKMKLKSCSRVAVQILPEEETLCANELLLLVQHRECHSRSYSDPQEVVWDVSKGATVNNLKHFLSSVYFLPEESIHIAKYFPLRFEWMVLEEQTMPKMGGKKKGKQNKTNIRQAPYHIRDGDIIGLKNLLLEGGEAKNDFSTAEDDKKQQELQKQAEEKRREREQRKKMLDECEGFLPKPRRPEVGISIKVENFSDAES